MNKRIEDVLEKFGINTDHKIGLACSGGGARGFSHIGVLTAFDRFEIKPDIMSGVSAGAIAVALYGAGLSPEDMTECFAGASGITAFTKLSLPKSGFFKLDKFAKMLESWLPVKQIEELKIPSVICATDFDNGKSIGWTKGEIIPRVIASCSIPVIFKPVILNETRYVDGGVLRNLPAWAIRDKCTSLIGSNCSPLKKIDFEKAGIIDMAYRTFHLMMKANTPQDLRLCDYVISVHNATSIGAFDISSMRKCIAAGYEAASRTLEKYLNNKS